MAKSYGARKELTPEEKAERELKARNKNKVISQCKLICARPNKDGDKIGIAVLNYSARVAGSTQLDVMSKMESNTAVLSKWCAVTPYLNQLVSAPILTDVGCVIAGDGEFVQLVSILDPDEYKAYMAITGKIFGDGDNAAGSAPSKQSGKQDAA
jgi:hypothetical protein